MICEEWKQLAGIFHFAIQAYLWYQGTNPDPYKFYETSLPPNLTTKDIKVINILPGLGKIYICLKLDKKVLNIPTAFF